MNIFRKNAHGTVLIVSALNYVGKCVIVSHAMNLVPSNLIVVTIALVFVENLVLPFVAYVLKMS